MRCLKGTGRLGTDPHGKPGGYIWQEMPLVEKNRQIRQRADSGVEVVEFALLGGECKYGEPIRTRSRLSGCHDMS